MDSPQPALSEPLYQEGCRWLNEGDCEAAERCFRQCLALAPDAWHAHANLAFALEQQRQYEAAEVSYLAALDINPCSAEVFVNFGSLLMSQKRLNDAHAAYAAAVQVDPNSSSAWSNFGVLLAGMKKEEEAETCLNKALQLNAYNAKATFNLSYLQLRQGRFKEGWQAFEARDWYQAMARHFACPRWSGESLAGKSLVIVYEAGHGDMIQFCRYIPPLKTSGVTRISLICHPALKRLLKQLDGLDEVIGFDETVPQTGWDHWTPLMSFPFYCNTTADSIPAAIPYLRAESELKTHWARHLPSGKFKVGLVWKGNPKFENDADRSLPHLNALAPLWHVPHVSYLALQKGCGEQEADNCSASCDITNLGPQMTDFADAAAIVAQLDLLICVDTAMGHLAGALGTPCWMLLPDYMTDWRWGAQGTQSRWYPDVVRLFRQSSSGDWAPVIQQVATALETLCELKAHSKIGI